MQVAKTVAITTAGALQVFLTTVPTQGYVGGAIAISLAWAPVTGNTCNITLNYGDGTSVTEQSAVPKNYVHIYTSAGTKTLTATVKDTYTGAEGTKTASLTIAAVLAATFAADKTSGDIPLTVTFTGTISGGYTPYSWTLNYGDGAASETGTSGSITKTHVYDRLGTFTATLTVQDALGVSLASRTIRLFTNPAEWWQTASDAEKAGLVTGGIILFAIVAYAAKKKLGKHR